MQGRKKARSSEKKSRVKASGRGCFLVVQKNLSQKESKARRDQGGTG